MPQVTRGRAPHAGVGPTPRAYENWLFLGPTVAENERIRIILAKVCQSTYLVKLILEIVLGKPNSQVLEFRIFC